MKGPRLSPVVAALAVGLFAHDARADCAQDADCKGGRVCTAGTCLVPASKVCAVDKDCPGDQTCSSRVCVAGATASPAPLATVATAPVVPGSQPASKNTTTVRIDAVGGTLTSNSGQTCMSPCALEVEQCTAPNTPTGCNSVRYTVGGDAKQYGPLQLERPTYITSRRQGVGTLVAGLVMLGIGTPTLIGSVSWNSSISACRSSFSSSTGATGTQAQIDACGSTTGPIVLIATSSVVDFIGLLLTIGGAVAVGNGRVPEVNGVVQTASSSPSPLTWSVAASPTTHGGYTFGVVGSF